MRVVNLATVDIAPAFSWMPPFDFTDGPDVADLSGAIGFVPDAAQRQFLDAMFAVRAGIPAARDVALICPRQNMKTASLEMALLGSLFLLQDRLIIYTAHLVSTAREVFVDLDGRIAAQPQLASQIKNVRRVNGEQEIETVTGSRLLFRARSTGGGRGLTGSRIFLDEAYALTPEQLGALLPTISTVRDAQIIYASSAGHTGSEVLRRIRDRGRKGDDPSLAYLEWCAPHRDCWPDCEHEPGTEGCAYDDESLWHQANPALHRRIDIESLRAERRSLPPSEFARERLGRWEDPVSVNDHPISLDAWDALADSETTTYEPKFGLACSADGGMFTIGVVGPGPSGTHLEIAKQDRGSEWVVEWLAERCQKWQTGVAMDSRGPAAFLVPDLVRAGVDITSPKPGDYAITCARLVDDIAGKRLRHTGQPQLAAAVSVASRRKFGDLWMFRRGTGSQDVSALESITLALWSLTNEPATAEPMIY